MRTDANSIASIQVNVNHFFETYYESGSSVGLQLASIVDFISPHNYGGTAGIVKTQVNAYGYAKPVLLEEYGYATDPVPQQAVYSEGPVICRQDTSNGSCGNRAPRFVSDNIYYVETQGYAGGIAFMIADVAESFKVIPGTSTSKDCSNPDVYQGLPFDWFTGLFAVGGTYCGGTYATAPGALKSTGYLVCMYHKNYQEGWCNRASLPLIRNYNLP